MLGSLILVLPLAAAEPGIKVQIVGGTVSGITAKNEFPSGSQLEPKRFSFIWRKTELGISYQKSTLSNTGRV